MKRKYSLKQDAKGAWWTSGKGEKARLSTHAEIYLWAELQAVLAIVAEAKIARRRDIAKI